MNLLSLALSLFVTNYTYTTDCGKDTFFSISSQTVVPEHPEPGDTVEWTVDYIVTDYMEVLQPRNVFYSIRNDITVVEPVEYDLCEELDCPLTSGTYSHTNVIVWPNDYYGKISLTSEWFDENDNELLCSSMVNFV